MIEFQGWYVFSFSKSFLEKIKLSIDYLEIKISTLINCTVILIK